MPTAEEIRGLMFLADSFTQHLAEGLGTGDPADDELGRLACRWISTLGSKRHIRDEESK
jgi:hypothetical protein